MFFSTLVLIVSRLISLLHVRLSRVIKIILTYLLTYIQSCKLAVTVDLTGSSGINADGAIT